MIRGRLTPTMVRVLQILAVAPAWGARLTKDGRVSEVTVRALARRGLVRRRDWRFPVEITERGRAVISDLRSEPPTSADPDSSLDRSPD